MQRAHGSQWWNMGQASTWLRSHRRTTHPILKFVLSIPNYASKNIDWHQCLFAYELIYASTIVTIKFSVLAFYRRVFATPDFRLISSAVAGLVAAWWIAVVLVSIFSCKPIYGFWDKTVHPDCINSKTFFIGNAVPNIATDIIILVLPIRMIWRLNTTRPQKISLSIIFLLGSL